MNSKDYFRYAFTAVSVCLFSVVIYSHFFPSVKTHTPAKKTSITEINFNSKKNTTPKNIDPNSMLKWHLFGKEALTETGKTDKTFNNKEFVVFNPEQLPKSNLKLDLSGLFTHQDNSKGHAIIIDKTGKEKSYKVGDVIKKNVKLHGVYNNHIVLSNNENLEILNLPEFRTQSPKQTNARSKFPGRKELADRNNS